MLDLGERLDAAQPVFDGEIGVGAHESEAVGRHQPGGALGSLDDRVDGQEVAAAPHRGDRAHQVAGRIGDRLGEEGLVEMGMGLDGGGGQHPAVEVDHVGVDVRRRDGCGDL